MANVLNRSTKELRRSVNTPEYPAEDWIINPDLSAVDGYASKYWVISGDTVSLMDEAARAAVDEAESAAAVAARKAAEIARLDSDPMLVALIKFEAQKSGQSEADIKAALVAAIEAA